MKAPSRRTTASFLGLIGQIERAGRLANQPQRCAARADSVSHWSVQQQLDHLLLTETALLEGLRQLLSGETTGEPEGRPTLTGWIVLWTGHIPRGKAKAPEFVLPTDRTPAEIAAGFDELREGYEALADSLGEIEQSAGTRSHPILGHFTAAQWLRFAHLHHRHHDKIIDDILRRASDS